MLSLLLLDQCLLAWPAWKWVLADLKLHFFANPDGFNVELSFEIVMSIPALSDILWTFFVQVDS